MYFSLRLGINFDRNLRFLQRIATANYLHSLIEPASSQHNLIKSSHVGRLSVIEDWINTTEEFKSELGFYRAFLMFVYA